MSCIPKVTGRVLPKDKKRKKKVTLRKVIERGAFVWFFLMIGLFFLFIGATMNFVVMESNSGRMPVLTDYPLSTNKYFAYTEANLVNFSILSDKHHFQNNIFSLGDVFLYIGVDIMGVTAGYSIIRGVQQRRKKDE